MNKEEKIAETYLINSLGFRNVVFEPDGNSPPDFSIDGRIAIEVRRLNQHYFTKDNAQGLEEDRFRLFKLIRSSLKEFNSQYKGDTYWVQIKFRRPVGKGPTVKKAIRKALTGFLNQPHAFPCDIKVINNICFSIFCSKPPVKGTVFQFAGGGDEESGGFVLAQFKKNFDHCVEEKSEKIRCHYHEYASWWLILVDKIAYSFDDREKSKIKSMVSVNSCWEKVIVLNSLRGNRILEI